MIYLDIVTMHTPSEKITCQGEMRLFEQQTVEQRFLRLKDDRFPGEEMLIPLESLEADSADFEAEIPKQLGQIPLLGSIV